MTDEELENLLLSSGLVSPEDLAQAVDETKKLKRPLEKIIIDRHLLTRASLYETIAQHLGFSYVNLENLQPNEELIKIMPMDLARQTQSIPIMIENGKLHIAMVDPTDLYYVDRIQLHTNMPLEIYLSSPEEIKEAQNKLYSERKITKDFLDDLKAKTSSESKGTAGEGSTVIQLVDLIIAQAVRDRASDIHIEPEQEITRIRFRIDGILHEIPSPPKEWESAIISRIKVLAGMDIAESRIPQDGHFQAKFEDRIIDFRVSTIPTVYGENLVMRLLDTASVMIGIEKLGFSTYEELKRFESIISKPYGIILSTGPTGSGKTTTLYSSLMRINTIDRNIVTIEDPVEYRLGLIRQIQVNPKAGITFANGLRSILRQDPDVIMVGEIRDLETAIISIQAALTGHLVLSTLHTNDAPSAVTRLVNMGVEPYLISACLIGVMAQRLVRVICDNCKEPYTPSKALLERWGLSGKENLILYRGRGCEQCRGTGYKGRTGIFELMIIDDELREMIISQASTVALRKKAQEKGMRLLAEDGVSKVLAGITTIEEVARVCEEQVELRPLTEAKAEASPAEPQIPPKEKPAITPVRVDASQLEEYQKRIANWLSRREK
ncbi:MAG: Flp pilus assembly complex ATPase component TadA [Candidatus Omnitrophica bacterium]|nr:Flp pilus assembly complex ATPase component TadA [Candidatus Omnitrophota bacterium]